jgi:glutathione synthase/RimK-type ligase-like ATP-grasp enzyme
VLQFARNNEIDLIIPVTDFTIAPLSQNRHQFQGVSCLAVGPHAAIEVAADKFRTICLARELRIPVPESVLVSSTDDMGRAAANLGLCSVQSRKSQQQSKNRSIPL